MVDSARLSDGTLRPSCGVDRDLRFALSHGVHSARIMPRRKDVASRIQRGLAMIERMGHRATAPRGHTGLANWTVTGATNYQVAMVSDLLAAVAFLALGFHRFVGPLSLASGVVLIGFLSFG